MSNKDFFELFDSMPMQPGPVVPSGGILLNRDSGRKPRNFSLEWAAGFADGEGCISLAKQRYLNNPARGITYRLSFCIVQNDLQVLQHFKDGMGIHSKIYPVKRLMQHNRQIYTLNYSGVKALELIRTLQPYLFRKQLEAQAALDYWTEGQCGQHPRGRRQWPADVIAIRERYFQKLKTLK
jgi:hypothetical protein